MSADPLWLDQAVYVAARAWARCEIDDNREQWREAVRAVLAFAARQPREITDAAEKARVE